MKKDAGMALTFFFAFCTRLNPGTFVNRKYQKDKNARTISEGCFISLPF
jgi:hypothetical protein